MTFNDMVAQLAHFAWGALLIDFLAARISVKKSIWFVAAAAFAKEFAESAWGLWEAKQPWGSGVEDTVFWFLGIFGGWLLARYWNRR